MTTISEDDQNAEKEAVLEKTRRFIRSKMEGEGSGHDWWHIHRVNQMALTLGKRENADLFIVELAALLHDLGDHKFYNGDLMVAPRLVREWLGQLKVEESTTEKVVQIISEVSFKGAAVTTDVSSIEAAVVQDADRLDAVGAVGIARAFAFGGSRSREMYNPEQKPASHADFDAYKSDNGHTVNHFYEKLLLLKNRMNTAAGKKMAADRHVFMEQFLDEFYKEWEGKA